MRRAQGFDSLQRQDGFGGNLESRPSRAGTHVGIRARGFNRMQDDILVYYMQGGGNLSTLRRDIRFEQALPEADRSEVFECMDSAIATNTKSVRDFLWVFSTGEGSLTERHSRIAANNMFPRDGLERKLTIAEDIAGEITSPDKFPRIIDGFLKTRDDNPSTSFATYLIRTIQNRTIDFLRRSGKYDYQLPDDPQLAQAIFDSATPLNMAEEQDIEEGVIFAEGAGVVRDVLYRTLNKPLLRKYYDVIVLRYWGDLSYEEIAQALGLGEGNIEKAANMVKSRLHRARELLRQPLIDAGYTSFQ